MTGELVQNNTLELISKGVSQSVANGLDSALGSTQTQEALFFWGVILVVFGLTAWLVSKRK